jgi:hypothetical protein
MKYWLTSKNKKRHQRTLNKLIRDVNKAIEQDNLWYGRFYIKQVESPQWHVYEDKSGAEYFVHLKFIDKCTGRYWIQAETVNHWRGSFGNGWRLWDKMNWFIVNYLDVWKEDFARERNYNAWRDYNKNVRVC